MHAKASLDATDGTKWEWAGHVRETRESWGAPRVRAGPGTCPCGCGAARSTCCTLTREPGSTTAGTTFSSPSSSESQTLTNNPAVLTGVPLGYHMRMTPVDNPETYERVGYLPVYGRDENGEHELSNLVVPLRRDRTDDAPSIAAMGVCGFGDLLCYPAAVRLTPYDAAATPANENAATRCWSTLTFVFLRRRSARRGRSPGPPRALPVPRRGAHNLREAVDQGVEDLPAATLSLAGVLRSGNRIDETREDKRRGAQLYGHPRSEAARGTWDQLEGGTS